MLADTIIEDCETTSANWNNWQWTKDDEWKKITIGMLVKCII